MTGERTPLTPSQVADRTGFKVQTLANWRVLGKGPKWFRVGRSVRYWSTEVDAFLAQADATSNTAAA